MRTAGPGGAGRRTRRRPLGGPRGERRPARWLRLALAVALLALLGAALAACEEEPAAGYTEEKDVPYDAKGGEELVLDVFLPAGEEDADEPEPRPAVLFFHGGAWRGGDKESVAPYAVAAAQRGMVGLAVDYRLDAPAALPGQLHDAQAAVEWAREHADEYAIDPERIGVMGSSAGGHLAALVATTGRGPLTSGDRVAAAVAWSGPMDLVALTTSPQAAPPSCTRTDCIDVAAWRALLTDVIGCIVDACPLRYASLSPLWRVSPDDSPMLLVNAVAELAVSVEQARSMTARLRAFSVAAELLEVPGDGHADAYAEAAIGPTLDFLERRLG